MKWGGALHASILLAGCAVPSPVSSSGTAIIQPARVKLDFSADRITTDFAGGNAGVAGRLVTIDDPARVASISKLVVALGAMRLLEHGKIDLDRDVGTYLGWQVRNPDFPDAPITMRHLLSHRSGLRDTIDYIAPLDGDLSQVLAQNKAWELRYPPGDYFSYANINSPLIVAVMESATGERFDRLMAQLVLGPLKLDACYNWGDGCSDGRRAQAVTLLRPNGDLAKVGQVLLKEGKPLLSQKTFAEMIGPLWIFDGNNGDDNKGYFKAYGLGVHWLDDGKGGQWIGHVGEAYSLRAGFWVNRKQGRGFVRYATMVDEFAPVGHCFETCP